jgi:hypothetical protein
VRLKYVTVEAGDYTAIDINMGKCSEWMIGHDKAKSLSASRPSPSDIANDVGILRALIKQVVARNEKTRQTRDAAMSPPRPEIG